jgi:hypothetical protein
MGDHLKMILWENYLKKLGQLERGKVPKGNGGRGRLFN